jgi:ribonuclease P protein component
LGRRLRYRRNQRLRTAEVGAVLATGRRVRGSCLSVQVRSNGLPIARLGLIVPKRHLPRAVDRNRVKRALREWFRCRQDSLRGQDVLVRITRTMPGTRLDIEDMNRLLAEIATAAVSNPSAESANR